MIITLGTVTSSPTSAGSLTSTTGPSLTTVTVTPTPHLPRLPRRQGRNIRATSQENITFDLNSIVTGVR